MKITRVLALSILSAAAGAAVADDITVATEAALSTKSRAEVRAEVMKACSDGALPMAGEMLNLRSPSATSTASAPSRDQVRAQLASARTARAAMAIEAP